MINTIDLVRHLQTMTIGASVLTPPRGDLPEAVENIAQFSWEQGYFDAIVEVHNWIDANTQRGA